MFRKLAKPAAPLLSLLLIAPVVHAQGLTRATSVMQTLKSSLMVIAPLFATIVVIVSFLGYMAHVIHKDVFIRLLIGGIGVGMASEFVGWLIPGG